MGISVRAPYCPWMVVPHGWWCPMDGGALTAHGWYPMDGDAHGWWCPSQAERLDPLCDKDAASLQACSWKGGGRWTVVKYH
eukprot:CAMPEP_0119108238 /NCGR_PEP_ID=MMETSP1180-20130426/13541_1 /TAXON_ID=3052 ORGANISM="Chlamydomonas cf sp, Strain CCMP681" /NCGR_SAMPLE_ID=MMETSP1180 /ASSEMBLY_ACC=CAM_ASM_000741 /LENGTH=80 /DNA_ID=CAMNT_0007093829 /DNA_START=366 /DNA_END=608 /DNA_ORIENTATION=+